MSDLCLWHCRITVKTLWHFTTGAIVATVCCFMEWKPIPWSSLGTVPQPIWKPREVWRTAATDSIELVTSAHYASQDLLTPLCQFTWPTTLWLSCCCFHSVIIPLTVDCGILRSEEVSPQNLLHRWHLITVPPGSNPFFHKQSAFLGAWFYTPVAVEAVGTPGFSYLD